MRTATIYVLCDSRETDPIKRVRYVGQTALPLRRRLKGHVYSAEHGGWTHRDRWIRAVRVGGGSVLIEPYAVVLASERAISERDAIGAFRSRGCRLTNATDGGEGMLNPDAETRLRLHLAFAGKPLTPEHRRKIAAAHKGKLLTAEQRARISATLKGRPLTLATREKMSAVRKGRKFSVEHSARISAAKIAYYAAHPEHRKKHSEDMKRRLKLHGRLVA